ncbi:MAG: MFS transporter, partial [Caldilineaceae bacterium]|nr:MFS transporter [Caldilineaceae bacterium]
MDRKRLFPIVLILFTNLLGSGVIIPILPLFAEGEFQGTVFQITLLATAFFAAQFVASPWLGRLSDRFGRRPVLLVSQAGTILSFVMFIYARQLGGLVDGLGLVLPMTGGMLILFLARILDGITGGNITIAQAYVSDITDEEHRTQGLGMLQAAFGMGFILGPAFGGLLSRYGVEAPFIGAALITTGTLLLTFFTLAESLPPEERQTEQERSGNRMPIQAVLGERALVFIMLIAFIGSLAFSALPAIFALYVDRVVFTAQESQDQVQLYIGLMLTFLGLAQVVTQVTALRPLRERLGERWLIIVGEIALVIAFLGIVPAQNAIVFTLLLAPLAFGRGVSEPALQSLVTRFGNERTRGQLLGIYQAARSLALIIGPIWAGYAFEAISPQAVFLGGAGLMAATLGLAFFLLPLNIKKKKKP